MTEKVTPVSAALAMKQERRRPGRERSTRADGGRDDPELREEEDQKRK
jgi:hypothetical protein